MISLDFTKNVSYPIGLDIGHQWVNMVQLGGNGALSAIAAEKARIGRVRDGEPAMLCEAIIEVIGEMLGRGKFVGRDVISNLPNEQLNITSFRLSQMGPEDTYEAVCNEASERFNLSGERDVIRYLKVGEVQQGEELKNEIVIFAVADEAVREQIEMLQAAGLNPVGIEPVPCALFRSFERPLRRNEDRNQALVFVDIGKCFTTVVFSRGSEITFVKEIDLGAMRFDEEIAVKLGISVEEASVLRSSLQMERNKSGGSIGKTATAVQSSLDVSTRQVIVDAVSSVSQEIAKEIGLCFRYYTVTFRGKRVEKAFFSGSGAYEDILLNVLKRQLTVEVEIAEPFRGIDISKVDLGGCRRSNLCEWTVATGLALKELKS